ncbi:MAG: hypothetical protein ACI4F7_01360 [Acutalibacteraceae bacterium]
MASVAQCCDSLVSVSMMDISVKAEVFGAAVTATLYFPLGTTLMRFLGPRQIIIFNNLPTSDI